MESNTNVEAKMGENVWAIQIKKCLDVLHQQEMEDDELCASVFNVPKELLAMRPEAYIPQSISIGPYHRCRSELHDMDRYKLAAARRFQKKINGRKFESVIVEEFKKRDWQIRCCYHKYIDYKGDSLAWIMALDAVFLLECLQFYVRHVDESSEANMKQLGHVLHPTGTSAAHNSVLRDVMMLENQLPLFLLQKLLEVQLGSKDMAAEKLCSLLKLVCDELSPFYFKLPDVSELNINERGHVLEVLYYAIVPCGSNNQSPNPIDEVENDTFVTADMSIVTQAFSRLWKIVSTINVLPIRFINELSQQMLELLSPLLSTLGILPVLRALKRVLALLVSKDAIKTGEEPSVSFIPPSRNELNIPSVADLYSAGVKFCRSYGDLTTIQFDEKTATLYLPRVKLDTNTEVILRNLVAFEASAAAGALVLRQYTDFMNGLIDCENDVRFLRERGIISNYLQSDGQVASMWNSMGKCVDLSKVTYLDKVIKDLNRYYNRKWNVIMVDCLNNHIFKSWKFLSLVAATILLFVTCLEAFCSVYNCTGG